MKPQPQTIKIHSGKFKNLTLQAPSCATTRPTKSIMRESFFNSIRLDLQGKIFIECFAGSGSMGIAALSENAKEAIFFEIDTNAVQILKTNLKKMQKIDENTKCKIFHADFLAQGREILAGIFENLDSQTQAILYLDPPFCIRDNFQNVYEKCFEILQDLLEKYGSKVSIVALECMQELQPPKHLGAHTLQKCRRFGKSKICYFAQN